MWTPPGTVRTLWVPSAAAQRLSAAAQRSFAAARSRPDGTRNRPDSTVHRLPLHRDRLPLPEPFRCQMNNIRYLTDVSMATTQTLSV